MVPSMFNSVQAACRFNLAPLPGLPPGAEGSSWAYEPAKAPQSLAPPTISSWAFLESLRLTRDSLQLEISMELRKYQQLMDRALILRKQQRERSLNDRNQYLTNDVKIEQPEDSPARQNKSQTNRKPAKVNDTKNIPKNFGKAIISFVQKNSGVVEKCLRNHKVEQGKFLVSLKAKKKSLHSISELRSLWMDEEYEYARVFRQLSCYFLRTRAHKYIFGSRIADFGSHLKYRFRILRALRNPRGFDCIKI